MNEKKRLRVFSLKVVYLLIAAILLVVLIATFFRHIDRVPLAWTEARISPKDPTRKTVRMPIEVLGAEGTTESRTFNLTREQVSAADKIFFYANNLSYQNKGSIRVNGGKWISLNYSDIKIFAKESAFGAMEQGGFNSIRFTIPSADLVAGENTLHFRFNTSDGISIGYRIFRLNLLDAEGNKVLPDSFFRFEDPNDWSAPSRYDSAENVKEGRDLWYNASLQNHYLPDGRKGSWYGNSLLEKRSIRASCTDCHTQDGRDLAYFSYSNHAIIERSKFHGLSKAEGSKITAYIRSLDVPRHGRPWNPPYQPGPSIGERPVEYWAAGAGIDAVLEDDADMLPYMFPDGTSQEAVDAYFDIDKMHDTTTVPIALQFPDWKHWLPVIHPKDAFGEHYAIQGEDGSFSAGEAHPKQNPFVQYPRLRDFLEQNDHDAIVGEKRTEFFNLMGDFWGSFRNFFTGSYGRGGGWRFSPTLPDHHLPISPWENGGFAQLTRTSLAKLMAVKFFELHQEFELEELNLRLRPNGRPAPRQWLHKHGYNVFEVPPHFTGPAWGPGNARFHGQWWITGIFESTNWYELQLIVNPGNGKPGAVGPVDFNYHPDFIRKSSIRPALQTLRYYRSMGYIYQLKGISRYRMLQMGPWNILPWDAPHDNGGTAFARKLDEVEPGLAVKVLNSMTSMMADALHHPSNHPNRFGRSWNPKQFHLHPREKSNFNPDFGRDDFSDRFYWFMKHYLDFGIEPVRVNRVIDWCETAWPLMDWDAIRRMSIMTGTPAMEGQAYRGRLGDFVAPDGMASDDLVVSRIVSGPEWLRATADGELSGIPQHGAVGPNRFYIEVTEPGGASSTILLNILVNGSADLFGYLQQGSSRSFLTKDGSRAGLAASTAEGSAVDGDHHSNDSRWVSGDRDWPHWIDIDLQGSHEISKLEFWTGHHGHNWPIRDFQFQHWDGTAWVDILTETGNTEAAYSKTFDPVSASRVRLYATAGSDNRFRLYDIAVYVVEEAEEEFDPDTKEIIAGTGTAETNVALNKPVTVDSGGGAVMTKDEEWNFHPASPGYGYIQHRGSGKRLRAENKDTVGLASEGTTGAAVEWTFDSHDGEWRFISSRSEGSKLAASPAQNQRLYLADPLATNEKVLWRAVKGVPHNQAPSFIADSMAVEAATEEQPYRARIVGLATDADGDPLNYRKVSGPSWLVIGPDGRLGGVPEDEDTGRNNWTVEVSDSSGASDRASLSIVVEPLVLPNIALNKPVRVDSEHANGSYPSANAVNGKRSGNQNRWVSADTNWPHWIIIDLQSVRSLGGMAFWTGNGGYNRPIADFKFQRFHEGKWVDIVTETGNANPEYSTRFKPVKTRYVRLYATGDAAGDTAKAARDKLVRLFEIEVYEKLPSPLTNVALNKPVAVDSKYDDQKHGHHAVDGDKTNNESRWVSADTDWPHWIAIDLRDTVEISRLKFWTGYQGHNKVISDFAFQYWNGRAWIDIFTETGNTNAAFRRSFKPVATNRVRLHATAGDEKIFRLYEIEVYGE